MNGVEGIPHLQVGEEVKCPDCRPMTADAGPSWSLSLARVHPRPARDPRMIQSTHALVLTCQLDGERFTSTEAAYLHQRDQHDPEGDPP